MRMAGCLSFHVVVWENLHFAGGNLTPRKTLEAILLTGHYWVLVTRQCFHSILRWFSLTQTSESDELMPCIFTSVHLQKGDGTLKMIFYIYSLRVSYPMHFSYIYP